MTKVTDPALLQQLEGGGRVADPALVQQLEGGPPPDERSWGEKYGAGLKYGLQRPAAGINLLMPDVLDEKVRAKVNEYLNKIGLDLPSNEQRRANLEVSRQAADNPVGRSAALTSEVVATAPAFAATGGATAGLPLAARAAAQGVTGAVVGATTQPEDRKTGAIAGGLGAAGGELLGSWLSRGLVKVGPKIQALLDEGVEPALSDIVKEGKGFRKIVGEGLGEVEKRFEAVPYLGGQLRSMKNEAQEVANTLTPEFQKFADNYGRENAGATVADAAKAFLKEKGKIPGLSTPNDPNFLENALATSIGLGGYAAVPELTTAAGIAAATAAVPYSVFPRTAARLATGRTVPQQALQRLSDVGVELAPTTGEVLAQHLRNKPVPRRVIPQRR